MREILKDACDSFDLLLKTYSQTHPSDSRRRRDISSSTVTAAAEAKKPQYDAL